MLRVLEAWAHGHDRHRLKGDYGPGSGIAPGVCLDPETDTPGATSGKFSAAWPAVFPWVATVGGIQKVNGTIHEKA